MTNSDNKCLSPPIYLDYNSTTPLHQDVIDAMIPYLKSFGNPSSSHYYGFETKFAVELARKQVCECISCDLDELIFTSGGTESNNYAIKGALMSKYQTTEKYHVITSKIEHPSVLEVFKYFENKGYFDVDYLNIKPNGLVDLEQLKYLLRKNTIFISVMHSNNEIGTLQPIKQITSLCKQFNPTIIVHTDASQSIGKVSVNVNDLGVDLLTICSHKFYGPKGIGALYIHHGVKLDPLFHGGGHEMCRRSGTENVLEIVGLGKACELVTKELEDRNLLMKRMTKRLYDGLVNKIGKNFIRVNGDQQLKLPNTLNISFPNIEANQILNEIGDKVAISTGAACHSTNESAYSPVLKALGLSSDIAKGTIRLSTGIYTTEKEIDNAVKIMSDTINKLKPDQLSNDTTTEEVEIKLTSLTKGMGCGCKLRPKDLNSILNQIPKQFPNPNVLVGSDTCDDAGVYKLRDDLAIVQTTDFFTPICDNPFDFGRIACANAISDIYAMGGTPISALNLVMFPSGKLPWSVLKRILEGAQEKAQEAGVYILGGHSIIDQEPKFGLAVTGTIHPDKVWKNSTAKAGNYLCLTKPIGTSIIQTGVKRQIINDENLQSLAIETMARLNKYACECLRDNDIQVNVCTDVTGFGLLGHLKEVCLGSHVGAQVYAQSVPLIDHEKIAEKYGRMNECISGGTSANFEFTKDVVDYDTTLQEHWKMILNDAQTSGGLLFGIEKQDLEKTLNAFKEKQVFIQCIGQFDEHNATNSSSMIRVKNEKLFQ